MAATKSTKKAKSSSSKKKAVAKKTTAKKTTAKKTKKNKSAKKSSVKKVGVTKKVSAAKKKVSKSKAKKTSSKKLKTNAAKSVVSSFLADVVKQAHKTHKAAQAQTKTWIKNLNSQDKQLSQLHKKHAASKGKSRSTLETKINKLQDDMSTTRTCLLNCENDADKIVTFIEWTTQLHSKPAIASYLQTQSTSRPTLVKPNYSGQEEYPEEIEEDDDMNFVFGDDDEDMDESSR